MSLFMSLAAAVEANVRDGDTVAMEGFTHLIPHAAGHGGAHPSYAHGYYTRDNAYYKTWDEISRDRDGFLAWMKAHVLEAGPEAFAAARKRLASASSAR
jgi:glutaconate CoA-transferase, subunit A